MTDSETPIGGMTVIGPTAATHRNYRISVVESTLGTLSPQLVVLCLSPAVSTMVRGLCLMYTTSKSTECLPTNSQPCSSVSPRESSQISSPVPMFVRLKISPQLGCPSDYILYHLSPAYKVGSRPPVVFFLQIPYSPLIYYGHPPQPPRLFPLLLGDFL